VWFRSSSSFERFLTAGAAATTLEGNSASIDEDPSCPGVEPIVHPERWQLPPNREQRLADHERQRGGDVFYFEWG
jgi:hypothetical protein